MGDFWTPVPSASDDDAIHDNVAGEIAAITEKATPVSGDLILIEDSAASNAKKKVQVGNLPSGGGGGGGASVAARISDPAGADQAIAPGTVTAVTFDTVDFDSDSFADLGTNNTRLTIPTGLGGLYLLGATVRYTATSGHYAFAGIRKNGSGRVTWQTTEISNTQNYVNSPTFLDLAAAGDYFECLVYTEGTDVTHNADGPYLWLVRLGDTIT